MAIHADEDLEKALKTSCSESPIQVGVSQLKEVRELAKHFEAKFNSQTRIYSPPPNHYQK